MIIKSMSRKKPTFSQLIDYMEDGRQDREFTINHNLFEDDPEIIKEKFKKNASFFKKQKNSVFMYHEVISITKSKQLSDKRQKEILREIILEYIHKRANNNLVYGVLHEDKTDNFHYHLLISSNENLAIKNFRLSKSQFEKIKKDLEVRVLEKYPELQQGVVINKPANEKISHKEYESKRRTGKQSKRDELKERLHLVFSSKDKISFFEALSKEDLEIYVRGKTTGIVDKKTGRKHRLKTLGMLGDFEKMSHIIESGETLKTDENSFSENRTPYKENVRVKNNQYTAEGRENKSHSSSEKESNHKTYKPDTKEENPSRKKSVPLTEDEIEIQKRKDILKKSRESEKDNDFNRTRNR
jgi:hypothetical protein